MNAVTADEVREFIIGRYAEALESAGRDPEDVDDDLDLMNEGIIDSFGVIELITAVEQRFGIELDMSGIDPEKLTVIAPLSEYIAAAIQKTDAA